jgi:ABC-2 type transport system permease protein
MRLFVHQLRADQLAFWRSREAAVFVFLFPVLLFLLLGTVYNGDYKGHPLPDYLVAGILGYGVANTAFGGLAILLVIRRESGLLKRIRSTPLPPTTYLAAVLASTLLVFALQAVAIVILGRLLYDAKLPSEPLSLVLALVLGAAAFAALGIALAALIRSAEGSSPIVNVVVLPMTFLSGGFGPTRDYPEVLRVIADVLPLKYLIDMVISIYLDNETIWKQGTAAAVVAAWGIVGLVVALRAFRWEPREG